MTNPFIVEAVKKWKRVEVLEYLKSKQNEFDLDDEDVKIIEKNKVAGQVFITLTEEKLLAPPYNLLGGPAGAIALLIRELIGKVQASVFFNKLEYSGESFQKKDDDLQTVKAIEKACANGPPHDQIPTSKLENSGESFQEKYDDLQTTKTIEKTCANGLPHDQIPSSNLLPETASQLLRYYDVWNRPYSEWPNLREFSDNLHDVYNICEKERVHSSFKLEIGVLRKLFVKEHPAQLRLTEMEEQLKMQQIPRIVKKICKRRIAKAIKLHAKKEIIKKELEIAQDTVIVGGYHRINKHYDDYHDASSQLMKRHLDSVNVAGSKKARVMKDSQK